MLNEICNGAAGGRAGGGIFAVVELHARAPVCAGRGVRAGDDVEGFCIGGAEVLLCKLARDAEASEGCERAEWNDAEGNAGGDGLDGCYGVEVGWCETEGARDSEGIVCLAECGIVLAHSAVDAEGVFGRSELDGDGADGKIDGDCGSAAERGVVEVEPGGGAEGRMSGEAQLLLGGEDADLNAAFALDGWIARDDEGGLGEIGFASEGLHVLGGEAAAVMEDGEWVAGERLLGEDVEDGVAESVGLRRRER